MWVLFVWVFICVFISYDTSIFFNSVLQSLFLSSFGTVQKLKLGSQTVVVHHLLLDLFPIIYPLHFQLLSQAKDQHLLMLHLRQLPSQLVFLHQLPSFKITTLEMSLFSIGFPDVGILNLMPESSASLSAPLMWIALQMNSAGTHTKTTAEVSLNDCMIILLSLR